MEQNLSLYRWYRILGDAMAWLPVFFLYFSAHLSLPDVLRLEALYYITVVLLEVPSGYFSDRLGRKATLIIAAGAFVLSYAAFIIAQDFVVFALAQLLLATGMAFRSGTDSAFLYDTLHCLGREDEYGSKEAQVQRQSLIAGAAAVVLGGMSATLELSYAYWISMIAAIGALLIAVRFSEPLTHKVSRTAENFSQQFLLCTRYLKDRQLSWLFVFFVVSFVLAHVPYEFYQPYLRLLESENLLSVVNAPEASGLLFGATMLLGAWVAGRSMDWRNRFGFNTVLLGAVLLQLVVIALMGLRLHPWIIGILLLRTMLMALLHAPMNAAIAPRVATGQRATYLSLQSLAGRLAFSISLYLGSMIVEVEVVDWPTLSRLLQVYALLGGVALLYLYLRRIRSHH